MAGEDVGDNIPITMRYIQSESGLTSDQSTGSTAQHVQITLLEFDRRFSVFNEFVHYDFQSPTKLPGKRMRLVKIALILTRNGPDDLKGAYDRIFCDPPFLSADCQTKDGLTLAALTVRWLSKAGAGEAQIVVCTGERMADLIHKLYRGIKTTTFLPKHSQDRLSNDFRCYANFESEVWKWAP
ncbi:MAG: hypothetical protein Q9168_000253 [Polycauliona sp. 1 TL-2023]